MILQDRGAQKLVWGVKGDAGTRIRMLCKNLVIRSSELSRYHTSNMLVRSVIHADDCMFVSDNEIRQSITRLQGFTATCTAAYYNLRSQAAGFNLLPHGMLCDPDFNWHCQTGLTIHA